MVSAIITCIIGVLLVNTVRHYDEKRSGRRWGFYEYIISIIVCFMFGFCFGHFVFFLLRV